MQKFNPGEFGLMDRDVFEGEKQEMLKVVKGRCRDLEAKLRNLEKYVGFLESVSEIDDQWLAKSNGEQSVGLLLSSSDLHKV